ncbi:HlyD family secretion protein [Motiliproteus sediminis]|uniref:HlyD family secretion protein n=1 Tax=Motiliproteus sediminis TaxID=1468178 RepID=UPI001AEFDBFE|nr:HlyD family secretion protein [Motiliproteus sediminis]
MSEPVESLDPVNAPAPQQPDPVRRLALYLTMVTASLFLYSVWAQRVIPFSGFGIVQANLIRIAPQVAGLVDDVAVVDNQLVEKGELLFSIETDNYQLALAQQEAHLATVGLVIGADTAAVQTAQARVIQAQAVRNNARLQVQRASDLNRRGLLSQSQYDQAEAAYLQAEGAVDEAEANLEKAKANLGPSGQQNPRLQEALANLRRARLDLLRTEVKAPGEGVITNVQLAPGHYVGVGSAAMTFIDADDIWITAMYGENSLEHIRPGLPVDIVLEVLPGRVFQGTVRSVGWGIAGGTSTESSSGLMNAPASSGDVRFPVLVTFDQRPPSGVRYGSEASVLVYTEEAGMLSMLGAAWIRLVSILTYLF